KLMAKRLWTIITWPSAILAVAFGSTLLALNPGLLHAPWMQVKLGFVALLIAYHLKSHFMYKALQKDVVKWSSNQMRLWNEGATIILFAIIFLVILRSALNWIFGLAGLVVLMILLMLGFKFYKHLRERNS